MQVLTYLWETLLPDLDWCCSHSQKPNDPSTPRFFLHSLLSHSNISVLPSEFTLSYVFA